MYLVVLVICVGRGNYLYSGCSVWCVVCVLWIGLGCLGRCLWRIGYLDCLLVVLGG